MARSLVGSPFDASTLKTKLFCTLDTTEFVPLNGSSTLREGTSSGG